MNDTNKTPEKRKSFEKIKKNFGIQINTKHTVVHRILTVYCFVFEICPLIAYSTGAPQGHPDAVDIRTIARRQKPCRATLTPP